MSSDGRYVWDGERWMPISPPRKCYWPADPESGSIADTGHRDEPQPGAGVLLPAWTLLLLGLMVGLGIVWYFMPGYFTGW